MFVFTLLLKGGLNHIMFPFLFFLFLLGSSSLMWHSSYVMFSLYPLLLSASLYVCDASLNTSLLEESVDMRFPIDDGMWSIITLGWFELDGVNTYIHETIYIALLQLQQKVSQRFTRKYKQKI